MTTHYEEACSRLDQAHEFRSMLGEAYRAPNPDRTAIASLHEGLRFVLAIAKIESNLEQAAQMRRLVDELVDEPFAGFDDHVAAALRVAERTPADVVDIKGAKS